MMAKLVQPAPLETKPPSVRENQGGSGTVVVLDEVSQVSTRDAATVLEAVAATPGASLWCLGDPRQAPAVGAGGLAAEVTMLGAQGAIVAPALRTNRRQRERADREALAELRAGRAAASQAMRAEHGWEHEEATPLATRQAMAEAVVADVVAHGAMAVAVLAVSHADCEDLADRIRARLVAGGHLGGPSLPDPAWGAGPDRSYAQGDRVLLHTKSGHAGLHNGSTGTVVAVDEAGLAVAFDGARQVSLPPEFVAGRRGDANPNLSHAWARTVDGSQGGTWEAVHLLGSASLNALVGYTGQSRGMAPTHTWNTRVLAVADHVGRAADDRSATEAVLAGLQREPVTTFAAADDPWVLDTRLRAERAGHLAVLDAAPPDRTPELRQAEEDARQAAWRADLAAGELAASRSPAVDVRATGRPAPLGTPGARRCRGGPAQRPRRRRSGESPQPGGDRSGRRRGPRGGRGRRLPGAPRLAAPAHRRPRRRVGPPLGGRHARRRATGRPAGFRRRAPPGRPGLLRRPPGRPRWPGGDAGGRRRARRGRAAPGRGRRRGRARRRPGPHPSGPGPGAGERRGRALPPAPRCILGDP